MPVVCTQSLRGLHASVATDAGATSHVVASALGHSSPTVTHAHYIDGATARRARPRRVIGKVAPDPALRVVGEEPATAAKAGTKGAAHADQAHDPQGGHGSGAARGQPRHDDRSCTRPPPNPLVRSPRGKRAALDELPRSQKGFRPFRCEGARGEFSWCEWGDSNPHGVTHWYLKPARLPIPPHSQGPEQLARRNVGMPQLVPEYKVLVRE